MAEPSSYTGGICASNISVSALKLGFNGWEWPPLVERACECEFWIAAVIVLCRAMSINTLSGPSFSPSIPSHPIFRNFPRKQLHRLRVLFVSPSFCQLFFTQPSLPDLPPLPYPYIRRHIYIVVELSAGV